MRVDRRGEFVFSLEFSEDSEFFRYSGKLLGRTCEGVFQEYSRAVKFEELPNCAIDLCDFVKAAEQGQSRVGQQLRIVAKPL